jgi:putative DNA primase/helicase
MTDAADPIKIVPGEMARIVDETLAALISSEANLYQRGGQLVHHVTVPVAAADGRITNSHRLLPVLAVRLAEVAAETVEFEKYDFKKRSWVRSNCSALIAETLLARGQFGALRVLNRVITCPTLRPDGTILQMPGYDLATSLLFDPGDCEFPPVEESPSRATALACLSDLKFLIREYDFVSGADRAVALAAILTAIIRPSLPTAPLIATTSPTSGSGKSHLIDTVSNIATGLFAAVISQGDNEAEFEKRLGSSILAGDAIASIDNCDAPLGGALLCQALTQPVLRVRVLGHSINIDAPSNAAIFATGVNLVLAGDITRRALLCSLDPRVERPELRAFASDAVNVARDRRGEFVCAALTIMRAFAISGERVGLPPIGSFGEWCRMVRDPLVWLGEADPCETMAKARSGDPQLAALRAVMEEWKTVIGDKRRSVAAIVDTANDRIPGTEDSGNWLYPNFRDALVLVCGDRGATLNPRRLGKWLAHVKERVVDNSRIVQDGSHGGSVLWRLDLVGPPP